MNKNLPGYLKCVECGEIYLIKPNQTFFKCYYCGNYDKKRSQLERSKEIENEKMVRKMINYLQVRHFPTVNININFPEISKSPTLCGWTTANPFTISIPKQTLYLPNDEITDTSAHETAHVPTWEEEPPLIEVDWEKGALMTWNPDHGPQWLNTYHKYRTDLFNQFSGFINQINPNSLFSKGYKRKEKDHYYYEYSNEDDDPDFNPYE